MVRENLARRFKPAGFEQPEGSRRNYVEPRRELQEAFDRWVEKLPDYYLNWEDLENQYKKACGLVQPIGEISYREANSLLVGFKPKTEGQKEAGLFISACYTHSPEDAIVFDADAPEIKFIGYRLERNKILINSGNLGCYYGEKASGTVVNNCASKSGLGEDSSGTIINNGEIEGNFSCMITSGLILNNGTVYGEFAVQASGLLVNKGKVGGLCGRNSSGMVIDAEKRNYIVPELRPKNLLGPKDIKRNPRLKKYLEELSEISRNIKDEQSAKRFLERYGSNPKESIEAEIKEILRNGGFEV